MPPPSRENAGTRRFQAVYNHQLHNISGYKDLDQERNEMIGKVVPIPDTIENHEGAKYLRNIYDAVTNELIGRVDVYELILAFGVTDPAIAQAIKKLVACGQRGKGDAIADLNGAISAIKRAINFQERKTNEVHSST